MANPLFAFVEINQWLDKAFLRPLPKLIPQWKHLRRDPQKVLAEGDIVIGPVKRYVTAASSGLLVGLASGGIILGILAEKLERQQPWERHLPWEVIGGVVVAGWVLAFFGVLWLLQGATMILRADGVELRRRGLVVRCPWALFSARGQPFQPGEGRVLLPVNPAAVAQATVNDRPGLDARGGKVRNNLLASKPPGQAVLYARYRARVMDLAELLLHLGGLLALEAAGEEPVELLEPTPEPVSAAPAPQIDAKGWVTVDLTRLEFPALCCECGRRTENVERYSGDPALFSSGNTRRPGTGDYVVVPVPVCEECSSRHWRKALRGAAVGFLFGLVPLGLFTVATLDVMNERIWPPMAGAIALVFTLTGAFFGWRYGAMRSRPVELKHYSRRDGTVALRFRRAEYTEALLEFMARRGLVQRPAAGAKREKKKKR